MPWMWYYSNRPKSLHAWLYLHFAALIKRHIYKFLQIEEEDHKFSLRYYLRDKKIAKLFRLTY